MDLGGERQGGLDVWAPSIAPPIGVELTDEQALACAFRILARDGFAENLAGHITWQRPGQEHMLVNPWGLWWREVRASDICAVDSDARVVAGRWDVTPAIHIHTELHRVRPDARVVVHNHPYHCTVLAVPGHRRGHHRLRGRRPGAGAQPRMGSAIEVQRRRPPLSRRGAPPGGCRSGSAVPGRGRGRG